MNYETLNFIIVPIISLIAVIIYAWTLRSSIKQNKIISSASLIPYYEEEILELKREEKEILFLDEILNCWMNLANDPVFLKDMREEFGAGITLKAIREKPYNSNFLFLYPLLNDSSPINRYLRKVVRFAEDIGKSELIVSHKLILFRKIRRSIATELFILQYKIKRLKNPGGFPIPFPTDIDDEEYFISSEIDDIEFFKNIRRLEKLISTK